MIEDADSESDWDIYWTDTGVSLERVLEMKQYQKINHFPGMHEICRKDHLARHSSRLGRLFPKEYNFLPKSWILPNDWEDFKRSFKPKRNQCFISKPDHGCQGKGIFLFKEPKDIADMDKTGMVVQSYIHNPCLIDGFKFDLRVYVLVTSVNPLRIFIYKDGLARFATEKYSKPTTKNLSKSCMHLTNYAINKASKSFVQDSIKGSKRTIQSVLEELEKMKGIDKEIVWKNVKDIIVKTVILVQSNLSKNCKPWFPSDHSSTFQGSQCFEILGFDILLDSKLKPWVLEVNHSPSFQCDSELDETLKTGVIDNAINLLHLSKKASKKYYSQQRADSIKRLFQETKKSSDTLLDKITRLPVLEGKDIVAHTDSSATLVESTLLENEDLMAIDSKYHQGLATYYSTYNPELLRRLSEWEDVRAGDYERIFPPNEKKKLGKYLYLLRGIIPANETNTSKARKEFLKNKQSKEKKVSTEKAKKMPMIPKTKGKSMSWPSRPLHPLQRKLSTSLSAPLVKERCQRVNLNIKIQDLNSSFNF